MSIKKNTPCDMDGICPYESESNSSCEYWCGAEEPQDEPEIWDKDEKDWPFSWNDVEE